MTKEKAGKIDLSLITDRILHSSAPVPLISCMYACLHAWIEVKSVLISIQPFSPFLLLPLSSISYTRATTTTSQFYFAVLFLVHFYIFSFFLSTESSLYNSFQLFFYLFPFTFCDYLTIMHPTRLDLIIFRINSFMWCLFSHLTTKPVLYPKNEQNAYILCMIYLYNMHKILNITKYPIKI